MLVIMAGTVMVVLDTTIVNVALHNIGVDLHAAEGIAWVVTAYLLGVCASQPATGWLADRFGRKAVYLGSLAAFTVASVLCALSINLPMLVVFRLLQGIGGGAVMPVGMAIVLDLFPKSRHGQAMATWGTTAMVAPAIGPTVGGWLVTAVSWHWLFLINAPIGVACLIFGIRLLPARSPRIDRPFDSMGLLFGSGGLSLAVVGLAEANKWGWSSPATLVCIGVGFTSLVLFVRHELATRHPLLELRVFSNRSFRLAMSAMVFVTLAQFGRMVFLALELESLRGFTPLKVGLIFMPPAIVTGAAMQIGGRLVDRVGPRTPIMAGCAIMATAMLALSLLTLTTPVWVIVTILCLQGLGTGCIMSPAMVAGLSQLPATLLSQGAALRTLGSQVSGAFAVAVLGAVVAFRLGGGTPSAARAQAAYNTCFLVAAVGVLFALFLAARLPRGIPDLDPEAEALSMVAE
jgi:EmrB/QacA subfamily drug resistance transporter